MDINRLTRDADDLIRKVVSRYNQIYIPAGSISQVELDLMLDDLRKLYDTFKTIGQVNLTLQHQLKKQEVTIMAQSPAEVQQNQAASSVSNFVPPQTDELVAATLQPEPDPGPELQTVTDIEPELQPEMEIEPEVISTPEPEIIPETIVHHETEIITRHEPEAHSAYARPITNAPEPAKPKEVKPAETPLVSKVETAQSMLADRFNSGSKSLSETIASTPVHGVGARMQYQPISDLSTGIGLNDKFSFISELFGNNSTQYEEAILRINKAVNIDEANWILQKYQNDEWGHKHETLARMKEFVKRRFI